MKTAHFAGTGDDVVHIGNVSVIAIVTFSCPGCTSNTVPKTDGDESLLVNAIGRYNGSHIINASDSSLTTTLTVEAHGSWTIDVANIPTATHVTSGTGDAVLFVSKEASEAKMVNHGEGNFVVTVYSKTGEDFAVNEIGSYSGTVPFDGPAFVQVESSGSWSIQAT